MLRDGGTYVEMGQFTDAGSIATSWHRICAKDLNVLGSWAFTGERPAARRRHALSHAATNIPGSTCRRSIRSPRRASAQAVADAMAMKTVKSTIVPWPELV